MPLVITEDSRQAAALEQAGATLPAPKRFMEFFTVHIENAHTRRAYYRTAGAFSDWCALHSIDDLARVEPMHVAAYIAGNLETAQYFT